MQCTEGMTLTSPSILILGGTGKTGRRISDILRDNQANVRTAARAGADVFFDWTDPTTHAAALTGVDRVYLVPPAFQTAFADTVIAFIKQAQAVGVQHVTYLSARGVEHAPDDVALRAVELYLMGGHGPLHTILRPSFFMQNFIEGSFADALTTGILALPAGDGAEAFIDALDIASVAAATLMAPAEHEGVQYELTGPDAITHAQVTEQLSAQGYPVTYQSVPVGEWITQATASGLPSDYAGFLAALLSGVADGKGARPTADVQRVLGRPPTPLSAVIARELKPAAA